MKELGAELYERLKTTAEKDAAAVGQEAQTAKEAGIEGVPMFIFDGRFAVSGAITAERKPRSPFLIRRSSVTGSPEAMPAPTP